jgi:hypothetical protein
MKYKVGDKFVRDARSCAFDSGEIVHLWPEMKLYVLEVEGADEIYIVRNQETLDSFYKKVPEFFEVGKTYKFKTDYSIGATLYTIRSVHEVDGAMNAVVTRKSRSGADLTILRYTHFAIMDEVS